MSIITAQQAHAPSTGYINVLQRDRIIRQMASHLVAGTTGGLDLTDDTDVIRYLLGTVEKYSARAVIDHMDAAVGLARETITAASMGLR